MWRHRTLIVPADHAGLARSLCAALAGPAGEGMFSTPLSASGLFPATHYISAGLIEDTFAALLPLDIPATAEAQAQRIPGHPEAVLAGLPEGYAPMPTLAEVQALFAALDITASDPLTRIAQLGLSLCAEPEIGEGGA
jgi:hypothetical protein